MGGRCIDFIVSTDIAVEQNRVCPGLAENLICKTEKQTSRIKEPRDKRRHI